MSLLKKHIVTYRICGVMEIWSDSPVSAKKEVEILNNSTNLLIGNLNREDLDIVNVEVVNSDQNSLALIDHYIQKWNNQRQITFGEILSDTHVILGRIEDQELKSILNGMMMIWEKDRPGLYLIERNLHIIRKLLG